MACRIMAFRLFSHIACNIIYCVRLVLDTSVLVAALRSAEGASHRLLRAALEERFLPLASVPLVLEYEAVLTREEHLAKSGLSREEVQLLLDSLVKVSEPVRLAFYWRPMLSDPDDDMVLETAVNGRADGLVTFNQADFRGVASRFGIEILSPGQAWQKAGKR
jgi:putative PIN family toxin of toxin-antitoxin system